MSRETLYWAKMAYFIYSHELIMTNCSGDILYCKNDLYQVSIILLRAESQVVFLSTGASS